MWDGVTRERTGRWVLGRANLDLEDVQLGRARGLRRFEMEFERFPQICQRLFFSLALAGDIQFETLGDVPVVFAPDGRGERSLHVTPPDEAGYGQKSRIPSRLVPARDRSSIGG